MKAYVSAPILGKDPASYQSQFRDMAECLRERHGWEVVVPTDIKNFHTRGRCSTAEEHTWNCNLRKDIPELLKCDAIVMGVGWTASRGCTLELYVATQCGLEAYELVSWDLLIRMGGRSV
jgi:hypothetical protein